MNPNQVLIKVWVVIFLLFNLPDIAIAQNVNDIKSYADSCIHNFFINKRILDNPLREIKQQKGKKLSVTSNFYQKQQLIKLKKSDTLILVTFGTYDNHVRDYLFIGYSGKTFKDNVILGRDLFENDLIILSTFLTKRTSELSIMYKRKLVREFSLLR